MLTLWPFQWCYNRVNTNVTKGYGTKNANIRNEIYRVPVIKRCGKDDRVKHETIRNVLNVEPLEETLQR